MSTPLTQTRTVAKFACLGDACPDTCCKGWGMQLTKETIQLYEQKAPELLEAVSSGEAEYIMKRDSATDYCVKFENGWCGIHTKYGDAFLGDACHFFPRATRTLGGRHVMTSSMACPEIARLVLTEDAPAKHVENSIERLPYSLKDYLPEGMAEAEAWEIHEAFLNTARGMKAERAIAVLNSVARSLDTMPAQQWAERLPFYLRMAEGGLPAPEGNASDPFNLLHALQGLVGAAYASERPRLMQTIKDMETALGVTLDWKTNGITLGKDSGMQYLRMDAMWRETSAQHYAPILSRWLEAQLSLVLFPFAGLGVTLAERMTIIAVRFATMKLALMSACFVRGAVLSEDETVRVVQSLSRFLDHLADATLSLRMYDETLWTRESRARALVGD